MVRLDIVAEARRWLHTPWIHQASLKAVGCDCIGLIAGVAKALGIPEAELWERDARRLSYARQPDPTMLRAAADDYLDPIALERAEIGDVILGRFQRDPQHFAILASTEPRRVIHAYSVVGEVVENMVDSKWRGGPVRFVAAYSFRGL